MLTGTDQVEPFQVSAFPGPSTIVQDVEVAQETEG
jgi:hypothetical protein